ncbi:exo-alpha-sialidase [uncultured Helicobacter sp.]|uniref:exo-alpha-sialidase n=1 Tax=uncultured Helicobacter sp. TaxID=175537 RepID=UPI00374FCFEE
MKIIKFVCFGICVLLASVLTYQSQHTNTAPFVLHSFDSLDSMAQETPILPHILEDSLDFSSNFMLVPNFEKSAHASSLVDLGTKLMVVFFAGSKEGARDVKIYQSFLYKGSKSWSEPKPILTPQWLSHQSGKFIKKLGNPVVFRDTLGKVHLFVVGVSLGGWSTSKIYQLFFDEDMESLKYVGELHLGMLVNFSHLVRTPPVLLQDGGFMLPVYHELADKYPLVVFFDAQGQMRFNKRLNNLRGQLQPSIVATTPSSCLEFSRSYTSDYAYLQACDDMGNVWHKPVRTNIKNYDSSSVLVNIGQEIVLIHNDGFNNPLLELYDLYGEDIHIHARASLSIFWLKNANEGIFERLLTLDVSKDKNGEVSYPAAVLDKDNLYITYTYNRKQIKYTKLRLDTLYELIAQAKEKSPAFFKEEDKEEPFIRLDDFYFAQTKSALQEVY